VTRTKLDKDKVNQGVRLEVETRSPGTLAWQILSDEQCMPHHSIK